MSSKLTWHTQSIPGWLTADLMNGKMVKVMDPPSTNPFPGKEVIGRVYIPDGEANNMIMCGAAGADDYFKRCESSYKRAGYVHAWEGPNEPPVQTTAQRAALVAFTKEWMHTMHQANHKVVVLCLGVGWPDIGQAPELAGALDGADYWALHEYSAPTMDNNASWLCLRYRRTVAELQEDGVTGIPPLLITECGLDGGVIGKPGKGWKTFTEGKRQDYMNQLAWYDKELQKDSYVKAATVFTSGPNYDWTDFDVDWGLSQLLHNYNAIATPEPKPEEPPMVITVQPRLPMPMRGEVAFVQGFGEHKVDYSKFQMIGHNGIDMWQAGAPEIVATHPGQCWVYDDPEGYGLAVEVWYPIIDGAVATFKTIYGHMSKQLVQDKQLVSPGMVLGIMGSTGNSTGPHLHYGLKLLKGVNPGYRNWVDPAPFMK